MKRPSHSGLMALLLCALSACIPLKKPEPKLDSTGSGVQQTTAMPHLVVQLSHGNDISSMALSSDGRFLATAGWDKSLRLWQTVTGRELRSIGPFDEYIHSIAFSADSKLLLSGGNDSHARLWSVESGEKRLDIKHHAKAITAVAFSPDNQHFATGGRDNQVFIHRAVNGEITQHLAKFNSAISALAFSSDGRYLLVGSHLSPTLWEVASGKKIVTYMGHQQGVKMIAFSDDGQHVYASSYDNTLRRWRISGEEEMIYTGHTGVINSIAETKGGAGVITGSEDKTVRYWDNATGNEVRRIGNHARRVVGLNVDPSGKVIYIASENRAIVWDLAADRQLLSFEGNSGLVSSIAISSNGRYVLLGSWDNVARLWDLETGMQIRQLIGHTDDIRRVGFSSDNRFMVTGSRDGSARVWNTLTGEIVSQLNAHQSPMRPVMFSPDDSYLATAGDDATVRLWDVHNDFRELRSFGAQQGHLLSLAISDDSRFLASSGIDPKIVVWNARNGTQERVIQGHENFVYSLEFTSDGDRLLSASLDKTARIWDLRRGKELLRLEGHTQGIFAAAFSPNEQLIATASQDGTARIWDAQSGDMRHVLQGHEGGVNDLVFTRDNRYLLTVGEDQTTRLWEMQNGKEICRLVSFSNGNWAVVDSEGRYDAANGGDINELHWVIGTEQIALYQLKDRYYEPGLLAKKLGLNTEPLRDVQAFTSPKLFPDIEINTPEGKPSMLDIKLRNRGGGIGRVTISINGKEVATDARGRGSNPDAEVMQIEQSISNHPYLIPGKKNLIEVRAYNKEGYLASRGVVREYVAPEDGQLKVPTLWAIISGVSDYSGDQIDLRYAAKDALDIANALSLGGHRFFGADKFRLRLLTTAPHPNAISPTKLNIQKAFEEIQKAKPWDIVLVFLAGHGITLHDTYYYLTADAYSTQLVDPAIRSSVTLSSDEIIRWLKKSPALKQGLILDTCAAGAAGNSLFEARDISSSQIRAIEEMKDRVGFHILMGSAADAFSFETTRYEQGLLTHALLRGMKGPALDSEGYVGTSLLFQYAVDEVPKLAAGIGGIQRPRVAAPRGSDFKLARLLEEDRGKIQLKSSKPFMLPPQFLNVERLYDDLQLTSQVRDKLRENDYSLLHDGEKRLPVVYVDSETFSNALRPTGIYKIDGVKVIVKMVMVKNYQQLKTFSAEGRVDNPADLTESIVLAIMQAASEVGER